MASKVLLSKQKVSIILNRLCHQLMERHGDFSNTVLVGLQPRGTLLLERLLELLKKEGFGVIQSGILDTTFFRDDFRRSEKPLNAKTTEMNVMVEGKEVVLIDDVLTTGATVEALARLLKRHGAARIHVFTLARLVMAEQVTIFEPGRHLSDEIGLHRTDQRA